VKPTLLAMLALVALLLGCGKEEVKPNQAAPATPPTTSPPPATASRPMPAVWSAGFS